MGERTGDICWYCERRCDTTFDSPERSPTVDHFRPLRRFPALAYAWSNWVYSCRRCNDNKDDGWPEQGYVDPCADAAEERPERHFDYDLLTGDIVPRTGLVGVARQNALRTIDDLGLNAVDVRYYRHRHTRRFVEDLSALPIGDRQDFAAVFTEQTAEYAGVTRMVVEQLTDLLR
ncbi:MAG: HNH endonuclease [Chloroflexota bacterium]|nr:HNH endonuclease [Chloroflexota bacterium]MDE3267361.1 HNH endonuclease [Chloroflexota bacterium]